MAANPFQYAVSQVQKKASELFNPVGQAISRVPQKFGNYIQQTPQYQGAQMYQRAFQSPQVQRQAINFGQNIYKAVNAPYEAVNRQMAPTLQKTKNMPLLQRIDTVLPQAAKSFSSNLLPGYVPNVVNPTMDLGYNAAKSAVKPFIPTDVKKYYGIRETGFEDVGNIAGGLGAANIPGNIVGGAIGVGMNRLPVVGSNGKVSDAQAFDEGFKFSAKLGPLGKLAETPLKGLLNKINPKTVNTVNSLVSQKLYKEAAKLLVRRAGASAVSGGVGFGVYNTTLPAKNLQERVAHALEGIATGAAFGAGTSIGGDVLGTGAKQLQRIYKNKPKLGMQSADVVIAPTDILISHEGAPDKARVEYYKKLIQSGKKVDPIVIVNEGAKYGIEDGKHRFQAYKELGYNQVPVIFKGGEEYQQMMARAESSVKLPKQLPKVNLKNIENPAKFDNPKNITKYDRDAINWLKAHPEELNKPIEVGVYGKADKMGNLTHFIENGQHRYQALKELGVEDIPVVVRNPSLPKELEGVAGTPKTVRVWKNSRFGNGGGYDDIPVIRKEENITLYQGGKAGDNRQFWTSDKKYAKQFGNVKEKTGTFYRVDNGNRVTSVYVEAPSKSTGLEGLGVKELGNKGNFSYRANDSVKPTFVSVIDDTGKTVGKLHLSPDTVGGRKVLHIDGIEVSPKFRNQGIGTELLRKAEDAIKETEYEGILARHETITNKKEIPTIFKKLGYQDVGEGLGLGKFFNQSKGVQNEVNRYTTPEDFIKAQEDFLKNLSPESRKASTKTLTNIFYENKITAPPIGNTGLLNKLDKTQFVEETLDPKIYNKIRKVGDFNIAKVGWHSGREWKVLPNDVTDFKIASDRAYEPIAEFHTREELWRYIKEKQLTNQSKGVQNADLSIKLPEYKPPVAPQVVNGKIKMKPIEGPKIEMPTTPNIPPENSPVQKIIQAIKEAKPLRKEQEALYSAERSKRLGQVIGVGKNMKGEAGYFGQLSKLKGEMPKVQFDPIRTNLKQGEVDQLFNQIRDSKYITEWEKINAQTGLSKLLGKEGGVIPTEGEIHLLNEVYGQEFTQALLDKRSRGAKLLDMAGNILNVPRTLMASFDLSAPLRQGWGLMGKPKQFGGAVKEMFTDLRSEKSYSQLLQSIKDHPNYLKMREGGLSLAQQGPLLTSREERFMSNYAEQIPGVGHIVRGSDRAYTGFLNKLRSDSFNDMLDKAINSGAPDTAETYKAIANFVNTATGRGSLGALNKASAVLSNALFSPRLMASRFQMMNPMTYVNLPPQVRQQALRAVLGSAAMALSAVGIAKMGGAEVGSDPRSADFGKIKVGNTRYDLWAGFQQPIRALSQIISGKVISTTTGREMTLGEGYKPMTRLDIVWNFLQSKESPVASFIMGMMQGQNGIGQPFNVPEEVISRMTPMILSDMFDLYQEHGVKGLPMAVPGAFGVGSQTYSWTPTSKEDKMQAAAMKEGGASNKDINNYLLEQTRRKVQMQQQKEELKKQVEPPILDIPSTAPKSLEQTIWDKVKGIIPNAEAGGINPKMAMPDQGQPNTAVPQVKTKESTGPSTASSMVLSDIQEEGIKNNLKYSNGRVEVIGNKIFIKGDNDTTIKVVDVGAAQPTGNVIQQAKQVATHQSQIGSVGVNAYFSQKLSDSDKNEIYKALGTNAQEVEFKALASLPDDKQASVLYNLLKDRKWKQEKVDAFIKSDVLTNSVVGKMEDQGLINESQAKDLKAYIKSTSIKLGKVSAGSGKKAKKIKMPKLKTIKVKYSKLKIKIPKPKKYKALLSKGKSNKYFK